MKFRFSLFVVNHERGEMIEYDRMDLARVPPALGIAVGAMKMLEILKNEKKEFVVVPGTTIQLVAVAEKDDA